tara:strand:- start:1243 stop:1551 length:309 start_codon:yes stop_codon:yes gene_type:complete
MKTISAVQSWANGQVVEATILDAYAIQDNLTSSATFWYGIFDDDMGQVFQGNLVMTGSDYTAYLTNQFAWDWVAQQLNLTITGDYVPPVVETPIVTEEIITE